MGVITHEQRMQLIEAEQERNTTLKILEKGFQMADAFINRQYLDFFSNAEILDLNRRYYNIMMMRPLR